MPDHPPQPATNMETKSALGAATGSQAARAQEAPDQDLWITGIGQISPLGQSAWETFAALLAGKTISDRLAELPEDTELVNQVRALGGVKSTQHSATDPTVDLAERAAREALQDAGYSGKKPFDGPCFMGTSKGAVTAWTAATGDLTHQGLHPKDAALATILGPHGYLDYHFQKRLGIPVVRHCVAACASSLVALDAARRHLEQTEAKRALVVTCESALLPVFIYAYRRLGVLCPREQYRAAPFARNQHGFVLGEQAAAVVLEKSPATDTGNQPGHTRLLKTVSLTDPYDLIRTNPQGEAIRRVAKELLGERRCDALLAHAPGTEVHEQIELDAVAEAQKDLPPVYGLKGAIGHGLGASGLVSLATACLCQRAKRLPPMPWLQNQTPKAHTASASGQAIPTHARFAVFAAGFAGHTAGAVIG